MLTGTYHLQPGFGLDRCQYCARTNLVFRYMGSDLEVRCCLCYGVHRGKLAQAMFDYWKAHKLHIEWDR